MVTALRMQESGALNFKAVNDVSSVFSRTKNPLINRMQAI